MTWDPNFYRRSGTSILQLWQLCSQKLNFQYMSAEAHRCSESVSYRREQFPLKV
jgi:hypothetical protein